MKLRNTLLVTIAAATLASCATAPQQATAPAITQPAVTRPTTSARIFVAAANPLAAEAGMAVLRRGGSAVDAAVAVQAMLSLVEPQSSGIGGGAFMTWYDAATRHVTVYDGRETAPAGATPDMFLDDNGKPLPFAVAVLSGRSTGVPGAVKMLAFAHEKHGNLPWRELFGDAERTARDGFIVSPRLGRFLANSLYPESSAPDVRAYFAKPGGGLVGPGDRLRNPAFAAFLDRLANEGPSALYTGRTAQAIVARVHQGEHPGTMTLADLAGYRPVEREAICGPYRAYLVCVPPPPSSGVGLLQLLMLLGHTDIDKRGPQDPKAWFQFAEASRLMYADRDRYVGDPAFVRVPVKGLLDPAYVAGRAELIGERAGPPPAAGNPPGAEKAGADRTLEPTGTSHFIVGDAHGNVVSMTTTVESIFGSGRMVDGFFLNNQMTDFSFTPRDAEGRPAANAVAAGKRPRSSMTPLVLLDGDRRFAGALGSAGGNAILAYVGKAMVGAVDWGLPMQDALALPNLVARGTMFNGEVDKFPPAVLAGLAARGVTVRPGQGEDSGLQGVILRNGRIDGGYDPRREGRVLVETVPVRR
ncbi:MULTISPECIES: gamma-glutamyltransferase [unclassified Sphingomonas]|uniref:gamma-glutamyltransferase n=1 Tax=unclassified Sphingomonas TaxID=196159 RepID=UPI00092CCEF6|nr:MULTISPECIES: gamma-glutamyltransferase [unclassified Sphingomonas]MBN8848842.1 gamma-glutamyltransferase [Sphingomonas sp.]OJV32854.1 MAG: gamma-glutamyltransferase [Sphingomonas sp. 67-36]